MARQVFYSFHYNEDNWRAAQVRNIGVVEGNRPAADNDWETVTRGGDAAIKNWIAAQLSGCSCTVVLVGQNTAGRKWINYEITESWRAGMGLLGICIHGLADRNSVTCKCGSTPFSGFSLNGKDLSTIVKLYDPPGMTTSRVYANISNGLADWVESAIQIRKRYL